MACCNEPSVALSQSGQNPALHVNYAKGMVLGVDDFTQEFTYLANRDQWALKEALGYGTSSGLAVTVDEDGENGGRVKVAKGAAVTPSGKLVCVPVDQCALLNKWLEKPDNGKEVDKLINSSPLLSPLASPPAGGMLSLYLVLCYADCKTSPVPIPGDPCRSEDQLMADSRIADDFHLALRTVAPGQREEGAVRDFVDWLKQVAVVDASPPPAADEKAWVDALGVAAKPWLDAAKASPPPATLPKLTDFMFGSPPSTLSIASTDLAAFLRVAFRFWVTDLRPQWMGRMCGAMAGADDDCVLLARLEMPVILAGSPGVWQVAGGKEVVLIDESSRPYLMSMRLLQEWLFYNSITEAPAAPPLPVVLPQNLASSDSPRFAGLTTTGAMQIAITTLDADLELNETHHCVVCASGLSLTLPKCSADNQGRVYIVKSQSGTSTVNCDPADTIDGETSKEVKLRKAVTLVSDGQQTWHVIATA